MRSFFAAFLSICSLLLCFVSCDKNQSVAQPVAFDSIMVDSVCPLFSSYNKPACHISVNMYVPTSDVDEELRLAIERFISMLPKDGAFEESTDGGVASVIKAYVRDYVFQYLKEGPDAIDSYGENYEAAATWMSYEESVNGRELFNQDGLLSYQVRIESYTGGAHGNTKTYNGVFDYEAKKALALSDLFNDSDLPALNTMIQNKLASDYECETVEQLSEKALFFSPTEIEATENFYANDSCITWVFDPYDIAPYSAGEVQVCLAWDEVSSMLTLDSPVSRFVNNR